MRAYIEMLTVLPVLAVCYQLYSFSVNSVGRKKQDRCQRLGIVYMTMGITALVFKSVITVFLGLILMMLGFRLLAKGLDRLATSVYQSVQE